MGSIGVAKLVAWGFVVLMLPVVACTSAEEEPAETGAVPAAAPPLQPPVAETATVTPTQAPPPPTALPTAASPTPEMPAPQGFKRLVNEEVGYSFVYPSDWGAVDGAEQWTPFVEGTNCETVVVVDAPSRGGPTAPARAYVQICAKPLADSLSLDDFMRQAYTDELLAGFQVIDLNESTFYQSVRQHMSAIGVLPSSTGFLQTDRHRIQIVAGVPTLPEKIADRFSQTQEIIDSFQLVETSP